jgi:hypothetical protein
VSVPSNFVEMQELKEEKRAWVILIVVHSLMAIILGIPVVENFNDLIGQVGLSWKGVTPLMHIAQPLAFVGLAFNTDKYGLSEHV